MLQKRCEGGLEIETKPNYWIKSDWIKVRLFYSQFMSCGPKCGLVWTVWLRSIGSTSVGTFCLRGRPLNLSKVCKKWQ